jgi:hypothetical protein
MFTFRDHVNLLTLPRWDALLNAEFEPIRRSEYEPEDLPLENVVHHRYSARLPEVAGQENKIRKVRRAFLDTCKNIQFQLQSGHINRFSGSRRPREHFLYAESENFATTPKTIIWFSFESIKPLMNSKITAAERNLCHFRIATMLLHEFTVRQTVTCISGISSSLGFSC